MHIISSSADSTAKALVGENYVFNADDFNSTVGSLPDGTITFNGDGGTSETPLNLKPNTNYVLMGTVKTVGGGTMQVVVRQGGNALATRVLNIVQQDFSAQPFATTGDVSDIYLQIGGTVDAGGWELVAPGPQVVEV